MQFLAQLFSKYNTVLHVHPYKTQIATGGVLWLLGDIISQKFENKGENIDWKRAAKMASYGFCVAGPLYAWWYKILDVKTIHILNSGKKYARARYIMTKLALDQVVFEVPYLMAFFSISTILMDDGTKGPVFKQITDKIKNEYIYTYVTDWKVWPPLQFLNFAFVPVRYHSMVVNSVCVGWNGFLSFVTNRGASSSPSQSSPSITSDTPSQSSSSDEISQESNLNSKNLIPLSNITSNFFSQNSIFANNFFSKPNGKLLFNLSSERTQISSIFSNPSILSFNHFCSPFNFKF